MFVSVFVFLFVFVFVFVSECEWASVSVRGWHQVPYIIFELYLNLYLNLYLMYLYLYLNVSEWVCRSEGRTCALAASSLSVSSAFLNSFTIYSTVLLRCHNSYNIIVFVFVFAFVFHYLLNYTALPQIPELFNYKTYSVSWTISCSKSPETRNLWRSCRPLWWRILV